ncbi:RIP metalloprotease RseP [Blattabacterium cuenoti]|uniref:RIP metalloprotease RseP n=1 Tax=Blattabacterium cuenoti TaxID=1653831 RepID=UPI00374DC650
MLIVIHELGHFFFAKFFNVHVEKFFLFFNPWFSLFKKRIGNTTYGIGWIPLGGYVKINGLNHQSKTSLEKKNKYSFNSKSSFQRLFIISGGIIANALLSITIFSFLFFYYGEVNLPIKNIQYGVEVGSLGKKIGFMNGDKVLSINGENVHYFSELPKSLLLGKKILINRMGNVINLSINNKTKKLIFNRKKNKTFTFQPRIPSIIYHIEKYKIAEKCGFQVNDEILSMDNDHILFFDQIKNMIFKENNKKWIFSINRNGTFIQKHIYVNINQLLGMRIQNGMDLSNIFCFEKMDYSLFKSIQYGYMRTCSVLKNQIHLFKNIFHTETGAYKQVGSFLSMAKEFPSVWNWEIFWNLTATLSIWLSFINIFPIPSLDGGYILFIIMEIFMGKKLSEKILERSTIVGFFIVSILMILVVVWDVFKVFFIS